MPSSGRRRSPGRTRPRPPGGPPARPVAGRPGQPLLTPKPAAPVRHEVERRSAVWLLYLARLPRWSVAVVIAALFLVGAAVPGAVGAAVLLALTALLALLAFVTWHAVPARGRGMRLAVIGILLAAALAKLFG